MNAFPRVITRKKITLYNYAHLKDIENVKNLSLIPRRRRSLFSSSTFIKVTWYLLLKRISREINITNLNKMRFCWCQKTEISFVWTVSYKYFGFQSVPYSIFMASLSTYINHYKTFYLASWSIFLWICLFHLNVFMRFVRFPALFFYNNTAIK